MKGITRILPSLSIGALALAVYWTTAYPSITWWEAGEYSAAAACLGLTGAPGSVLLTLFGWAISRISPNSPAFALNLFAGLVASLTVVCIYLASRRVQSLVLERAPNRSFGVETFFVILASGIIVCSRTLWEYAVMFTPYDLTALFTALILLSLLRWWTHADDPDAWKDLSRVSLLVGIDFSVHRTNAVLVPGIVVLMLIRNHRVFFNYKSYLAAFLGMALGLSIQLLYIPMSLRDPLFNMGETNDLSRWWAFVSLEQYGGNFLMDILDRKGPLWTYQIPYYFKGFGDSFFYFSGPTVLLGFVPAVLGLTGFGYLYKNNRKAAAALALLLVITIAVSIAYFNVPENYFRSLYRHFLPTYVIFSVFILLGAYSITRIPLGRFRRGRHVFAAIAMLLLLGASLTQYLSNVGHCNGSTRTFAVDHASNIINSIDTHGIVFSNGDNNYFPEVYLQIGEKQRPDILHCNLSLLNLDWYIKQKQRHTKDFPFLGEGIDITRIQQEDSGIRVTAISLPEDVKRRYASQLDTFHLTLPLLRQGTPNLLADYVLFDIIKNTRWKRPIYFIKQGLGSELYSWLRPYLRDEGLVFAFVPDSSLSVDVNAIERNLNTLKLSGYNDYSVSLDDVSRMVGREYYDMYLKVAGHKAETGDWKGLSWYLEQMKRSLPFDRLQPDEKVVEEARRLDALLVNPKSTP